MERDGRDGRAVKRERRVPEEEEEMRIKGGRAEGRGGRDVVTKFLITFFFFFFSRTAVADELNLTDAFVQFSHRQVCASFVTLSRGKVRIEGERKRERGIEGEESKKKKREGRRDGNKRSKDRRGRN